MPPTINTSNVWLDGGLDWWRKKKILKTHPKLEPIVELDMKNIPNLVECYKVRALVKCNQPQKSIKVASPNED
jgi:hypothetical protein